jgi:hypothetical protein
LIAALSLFLLVADALVRVSTFTVELKTRVDMLEQRAREQDDARRDIDRIKGELKKRGKPALSNPTDRSSPRR